MIGTFPLNEALANMLAQLPTPTETETLSLNQAANRVLAQDIISPINVPSFDNSANGWLCNQIWRI